MDNPFSAPPAQLEIIEETDRFLAVSKPGGLLTQAPSGIDSMEVRVKHYLAQKNRDTGKIYLGVPHRLDRPASGVMVFAKNKKTARFLAEQFQQRTVKKKYLALVQGHLTTEHKTWKDWMRKVPGEARSEICEKTTDGAQNAVLHLSSSPHGPGTSLLTIQLETGRSHQIRLQTSSRGFAICGDQLYGSRIPYGPQTEDQRARWIALHASELTICSPETNQPVCLRAELPKYWPVATNSESNS